MTFSDGSADSNYLEGENNAALNNTTSTHIEGANNIASGNVLYVEGYGNNVVQYSYAGGGNIILKWCWQTQFC